MSETTRTTTTTTTRTKPNILVTGTPGVGKTSTASLIAEQLEGFKHICIGDLVKEQKMVEGHDDELDTDILDEDQLLDTLETIMEDEEEGGIVMDFHVCEIFPERWFDLVLVLRTRTEVLFDRLTARGYSEKKRAENMESEIMQVILEEARDAYDVNIVHEVPSNTMEDMESNIQRVKLWNEQWLKDRKAGSNSV